MQANTNIHDAVYGGDVSAIISLHKKHGDAILEASYQESSSSTYRAVVENMVVVKKLAGEIVMGYEVGKTVVTFAALGLPGIFSMALLRWGGKFLIHGATKAVAGYGLNGFFNADYSRTNKNGWKPLHFAALSGSIPAAQELLRLGASPAATTPDGKIFLDIATQFSHSEFVKAIEIFLPHSLELQEESEVQFAAQRR